MWNPFRKSKRKAENTVAPPAAAKSKQTAAAKPEPSRTLSKAVTTSDWTERKRPVHRAFPGPRETDVPLRVACERGAYAEVIAHAKESLQAEICGALVGEVCADEQGPFVEVKAAIRGTSARQGSTHVTFTQETWNTIHQTLEKQYPKLQIVGWYHSHPGFGVEFSEMDRFIQKNFFPAPTQIAFVTDPLGGDVAICFNAPEGIRHLRRFWVDAREHHCRVPESEAPAAASTPIAAVADNRSMSRMQDDLRAVEARLGQVIQALDDERARSGRVLMTLFLLVASGVVVFIGWNIYSSYTSKLEPPRLNQYVSIPVQIGDKKVMLGVQIVDWDVPPELNSLMLQMLERERQAIEKAVAAELKKKGLPAPNNPNTNAPAPAPSNSTPKP
jgi:proteasome lid subunit RPN8/RPN11